MTAPESPKQSRRLWLPIALAFVVGLGLMAAVAALLVSIQTHKVEEVQYPLKVVEMDTTELDPEIWGKNYPREYNTFVKTEDTTIETPHGGSVKEDLLAERPAMKRIWAGYAFSVEYNSARGHYYMLSDQKETKRQEFTTQPGACANCHTAQAPQLIEQMGWEAFNSTPYKEISPTLHFASSCADCHDPDTMALRISRPAFKNAMAERGIDLEKATRQEMRSYVCAQCHVEYYFAGDKKLLTFPWDKGLNVDEIVAYYDELGFTDWTHGETGAPMLKAQHPDFELWSSGVHSRAGVACADCHMSYVRDGAVKVSDHWLRSPLTNINQACGPCHNETEQEMEDRVVEIQDRTAALLERTDAAMVEAIDAIQAARAAGASDADLADAWSLHRNASFRWDFVSSGNGTGFHSPQEAARILALAIDYARQAQVAAEKVSAAKK